MARLEDHLRLIRRIYSDSGAAAFGALIAGAVTLVGFAIEYVLPPEYKVALQGMFTDVAEHRRLLFEIFLISLVVVLYRMLVPRVAIEFSRKESNMYKDGIRQFRVNLNNYGDHLEDVSFRLDAVLRDDGTAMPSDRRGFQREAGRGPMPLSTESPKFGRLVQMNERDPNSEIEVLTVSDLERGYQPDPIWLPRGNYTLLVSLNPRIGRPDKARFSVGVSPEGSLVVKKL